MALYEFKHEDVFSFARFVGFKTRQKGYELVFDTCPYCKNQKDKGTFSINIKTGQFECKRSSCGVRGNMLTLARDFSFTLSDSMDRYYEQNEYENKFRKFKEFHKNPNAKVIEYLDSRDISREIAEKYEITYKEGNDSVMVFPFKDQKNELCFIKYRNMDFVKGKTEGHKEWCEKNCKPILFGMNHCEDFESLVITEGQLDSLSLAEAGIKNAVSVPIGCNGFTWIPHCWDWLIKFKELVIFGDCENGKITLSETLSKRFPNTVRIVRVEDYKGCKDANEILQNYGKEYLVAAVEQAEAIPLYFLKPLEEVKKVKIEDIQYIPTGIKSVDDILSGGFHEGELVILSGKRGGGKSTLASQILCSVTNNQYKSFVYSGELPDFIFRAWFDKQYFGISEQGASYNGKIFLFDNNVIQTDDHVSIINAVEESIKRYNVKFILLDNLMTIVDADSSERLYRAQSKFVGQLVQITKKYNVVSVLVVHPRKQSSLDLNDDVSGASEITNKADIVMTYSMDRDLPQSQRYLSISKNRLTGRLTKDMVLYYDDATKRITDIDGCFDWSYGFAKMEENHSDQDDDTKEIPF